VGRLGWAVGRYRATGLLFMRSPVPSGNLRSLKTFDSPLPCGQAVLVVKRIWTMSSTIRGYSRSDKILLGLDGERVNEAIQDLLEPGRQGKGQRSSCPEATQERSVA
jgi:hypothetical protein